MPTQDRAGRFGTQPLKAMLRASGVAQEDAATRVGVSREYVSMILNGHARPSLAVAARLAQLVDRPMEECFSRSMLGLA